MDDEKELREWLDKTYPGLKPDRSAASHALELLKTERANREWHSAKANITQAVAQLEMARGWVERALNELLRLEKEKS
jgi:hypothetical protein